MPLRLQPQEIPFDHEDSNCFFGALHPRAFAATPAAMARFGQLAIADCLFQLQKLALDQCGLDYLQVFVDPDDPEQRLWFIDDGAEAVTALLPEDY